MPNFKPSVRVITHETQRDFHNSYNTKSPYKYISYPTYKELLKNIKRHLEENIETCISVSRSRRGQLGEWYENWELRNGKPVIVKQGWM